MTDLQARMARASSGGRRIGPVETRGLYDSFCEQVVRMSEEIDVEAAPFETRFTGPGGLSLKLVPYRTLFMVSVGSSPACEIRVRDEAAWFKAMDMALEHFLTCFPNA